MTIMGDPAELRFKGAGEEEAATALFLRPPQARWLLVLGHGAGAGMRHPFMQQMSEALAQVGIATFRYEFPYMARGRRLPDPTPVLVRTVRLAVAVAASTAPDLPLLAGGKSMGGRMTSLAAAEGGLSSVRGLVFLGFPLHPAGRPATERAAHLDRVIVPMLFLQGTRDRLADLELLRPICDQLGTRATLHVVEDADHEFQVLKRTGRTQEQVLRELAETICAWATALP